MTDRNGPEADSDGAVLLNSKCKLLAWLIFC